MFLKQLDNLIRNVGQASRIAAVDRRSGEERRKQKDRRAEKRYGDGVDRRVTPDRRQAVAAPLQRRWYESLSGDY